MPICLRRRSCLLVDLFYRGGLARPATVDADIILVIRLPQNNTVRSEGCGHGDSWSTEVHYGVLPPRASSGLFGVPVPCCAAAGIAMAINNDSRSSDESRIIVVSSHTSFRPEKKNGHTNI